MGFDYSAFSDAVAVSESVVIISPEIAIRGFGCNQPVLIIVGVYRPCPVATIFTDEVAIEIKGISLSPTCVYWFKLLVV